MNELLMLGILIGIPIGIAIDRWLRAVSESPRFNGWR